MRPRVFFLLWYLIPAGIAYHLARPVFFLFGKGERLLDSGSYFIFHRVLLLFSPISFRIILVSVSCIQGLVPLPFLTWTVHGNKLRTLCTSIGFSFLGNSQESAERDSGLGCDFWRSSTLVVFSFRGLDAFMLVWYDRSRVYKVRLMHSRWHGCPAWLVGLSRLAVLVSRWMGVPVRNSEIGTGPDEMRGGNEQRSVCSLAAGWLAGYDAYEYKV